TLFRSGGEVHEVAAVRAAGDVGRPEAALAGPRRLGGQGVAADGPRARGRGGGGDRDGAARAAGGVGVVRGTGADHVRVGEVGGDDGRRGREERCCQQEGQGHG